MAYVVRAQLDICWVPDGGGGATLAQNQSNQPGYGSALGPGPTPAAQSLTLFVSEGVAGGDTLTGGNLNTAITAAATDLETLTTTLGAWGGNTTQTPLAIATAWATGGE